MIPLHAIDTASSRSRPKVVNLSESSVRNASRVQITNLTINIPDSQVRPSSLEPPAARWNTLEFRIYLTIFVLVVPFIIYWPTKLSDQGHPGYLRYSYRLTPGWLFGRQIDNSDPQYRSFRNNVPALLLLSGIYLICSTVFQRIFSTDTSQISVPDAVTGYRRRAAFITIFAGLMLLILHGISAFKILLILALNYHLIRIPKSSVLVKAWPALLIIGNMGILFLNERYDGYRFGGLGSIFQTLDAYNGVLPRWHIGFNITMLRIISFGLDYHWRNDKLASTPENADEPTDYRTRVSTSLADFEYSFLNYLAYCLYPPLYIAGPIITFNDFIHQLRHPTKIPIRNKLSYAFRFLVSLFTMEAVLHTMYVVAIKDTAIWENYSPADLSMIGVWNLVVVWLKLLIPWRFFRLWALLDGMDPPENMIRCVLNNYSTMGFWRSWHRSYNLWLLRYIYIPLGGNHNIALSTICVFTFVALWHDLSFKLLAWGWLISIFILPELIARRTFTAEKYAHRWWYRHLCAVGGVANQLFMMTANLIGFVLGIEGITHFIKELTASIGGLTFLVFACSCLFVGVQLMMEYREEERRKGIDRRC